MKSSDQIDQLATALAEAQAEFTNPERNREVKVATKNGGSYTFTYSTLDCVMDMARPILANHGLSITQPPTVKEGVVVVTTRLMHKSGQWQEEEISARPEGGGVQQIGSAITYLKRYAYCGMLGIAPDEDDDGNGASGNDLEDMKERPRQSTPRGDMPTCPECGRNTGVIKGKEEYGGGWVCFAKKGGCGHKWQTVQDLAQQTGMTTGDKIEQPKNGKHAELSADEMESYGKYQRYFAAAWTEGAYRKFCDMLSGEASQSLKAKLEIAMDDAQLRTELLTQESIDDATMDAIGVWMTKTPDIRDLERWMGEVMECDPCPFSENQKAKLVRWFGKEQGKHGVGAK